MRYASDESDTDNDVSPASKRKARKAQKAKAGSDEDDDASPVARRPKSRRRSAAAKEVRSGSESALLTAFPSKTGMEQPSSRVPMENCRLLMSKLQLDMTC